MGADEWWRIEKRLRRLNELGYDAAQIQVTEQDGNNPHVLVQTQVVEAGHHRRRLQELTGLSVQENQARRILNDLYSFRSRAGAFRVRGRWLCGWGQVRAVGALTAAAWAGRSAWPPAGAACW